MNSQEDTDYRLSLARGFRDTAERDFARGEWASCVEHGQLAVENAAKAVIACFGPVPRTHEPKDDLEEIVNTSANLPSDISIAIQRIISSCNDLGRRTHILASYGDERARLTPWQLLTRTEADSALQQARSAVGNAEEVVRHSYPPSP